MGWCFPAGSGSLLFGVGIPFLGWLYGTKRNNKAMVGETLFERLKTKENHRFGGPIFQNATRASWFGLLIAKFPLPGVCLWIP